MLALSLFFSRFWCRNLCPAGAFLSLWNGLRLTPRLRRPVRPNQCPFGVLTPTDLDCLNCDRCRMGQGTVARAEKAGWAKEAMYFALVALSAILLLGQALRSPASARAAASVDAAGRPAAPGAVIRTPVGNRPANVERIRALIDRGRLSDREALYYRQLSNDEVGPASADQNGMPEMPERD